MANRIPAFLLDSKHGGEDDQHLFSRSDAKRTRGVSFIDRGIHGLGNVIRTTYVQWETSSGRGLLQRFDPRVKLLFLLFFAIVISLQRDLVHALAMAAFIFCLVSLSFLRIAVFYWRVLFVGFFLGFLMAAPSSLNIIVPGEVILPLIRFSQPHEFLIYNVPPTVGITSHGLILTAMITLRVMNSLALSLLVMYTTPLQDIIRALKIFRVPDAFLLVVLLSYRYIFIFAGLAEDMHLAVRSRIVGGISGPEARKWIAGRMAVLFRKTRLRCEDVFNAMRARGFSGETRLPECGRLATADWVAGVLLFAVGTVFLWI
jgi:energy-coupling factor transporter transmembrane protein EcfT